MQELLSPAPPESRLLQVLMRYVLPLAALLWLASLVVRTAWLCDDAYITYRTVDNFVNGHGLTWNTIERVQAFTHPLWMFLNSMVYFVWRNMYGAGMLVSMGVSLAAVLLILLRATRTPAHGALALLLLSASPSFLDYTTSGLENPATHLLLVALFFIWTKKEITIRIFFWLCFTCALTMMNRMDTMLFFLPVLVISFWKVKSLRAVGAAFLGFAPFFLWEIFSVLYYGFPFPNTAYAKLSNGIPANEYWMHGMLYYKNFILWDPAGLAAIAAGFILPVITRNWKMLPLLAGVVLYLIYILRIGGDFMSGRFFTGPILMCALCAVYAEWKWKWVTPAVTVVVFVLQFWGPHPSVYTTADYGRKRFDIFDSNMIADERKYYYPLMGLLTSSPDGRECPGINWVNLGKQWRAEGTPLVNFGNIGFAGFYGGPGVYIVDNYGLSDPLMARIPAKIDPHWRPGHIEKFVPAGYETTLVSGINQIQDPFLARYYDKLVIITREPVFSPGRLKTIWEMNTGRYDGLIVKENYRR